MMTQTLSLIVNGQAREVSEGTTVEQLLKQLDVVAERVVVEVNVKILRRKEHIDTVLKTGDRVEIVRFVGGGSVDRLSPLQVRSSIRCSSRKHAEESWPNGIS